MYKTKNDLPEKNRSEIVTILNARLADRAQYIAVIKQHRRLQKIRHGHHIQRAPFYEKRPLGADTTQVSVLACALQVRHLEPIGRKQVFRKETVMVTCRYFAHHQHSLWFCQ